MYKERNVVAQLMRRAERAGCKAIALTVYIPIMVCREADIKNRCIFSHHCYERLRYKYKLELAFG